VLLTITTTHRPATDLGYLLHKHPDRVRTFGVPFGQTHVFYPEATGDRCTAALLLEIDPVGLIRRGGGRSSFALAEYVNDRPYVASSFLAVAMNSVFKTAKLGCRPCLRVAERRWSAASSSRSATESSSLPFRSTPSHLSGARR
jgi:hypothetical protein